MPIAAVHAPARLAIYVRDYRKDATGEREEMESDMLDFAFEVKDNSRLSARLKSAMLWMG